jgi:Zn-dependent protease
MFGLNFDLPTVLTYITILVIAISLHEFAHAKVADMLGDSTPRSMGRVTLNPLSHLDPIGSIMMIFAGFGWGRPVPVNPYAVTRRTPAGLMWVSLAGPATNVLLAILGAIPLRLGITSYVPAQPFLPSSGTFFTAFVFTNLFLALFNLIPLAPLDGDKIADYFMPPSVSRVLDTIRPYGPMILILLLFVGPNLGFDLIGQFVVPPVARLMNLLVG